jgi:uncharacterized protein (DUF1499 family)
LTGEPAEIARSSRAMMASGRESRPASTGLRWSAAALLVTPLAGVAVLAIIMRLVPDDPAVWHVDPVTAQRTGAPNDYLVAPEGATAAAPDRIAEVRALQPGDLLRSFDAVAMRAPRTEQIAGSADEGWITYVQRSRVFGFPDYVSVRAVEVPGGSALIVWSRSRFGHGDFGVNRARVEGWLAALDG